MMETFPVVAGLYYGSGYLCCSGYDRTTPGVIVVTIYPAGLVPATVVTGRLAEVPPIGTGTEGLKIPISTPPLHDST